MTRRTEINVYPFQRLTSNSGAARNGRTLSAALLLLSSMCVPVTVAQSIETSWFEIELLAFSRDNNRPLLEQFPAKVTKIATLGSIDLLSPMYQPDLTAVIAAAPACARSELSLGSDPTLTLTTDVVTAPLFATDEGSLAEFQFQQSKFNLPLSDGYQPLPELCAMTLATVESGELNPVLPAMIQISAQPPMMLPLTPLGQEQHQPHPYIAPESALQLKDLAYQLKHRGGHQLLLHTAWRQSLSGKRQAKPYRWFAGSNFGQQFDYFGRSKANMVNPSLGTDQFIQQIDALEQALLANPATALAELQPAIQQNTNAAVWQLDGLVRIYSERMLFAETEFNLRRLTGDGSKLSTYHSKDQSRLLIGEVHYLDHPHLGLVLQIRRFTPPLLPAPENAVNTAANATN
jgi:hypothetical protein